MKTIKITLHSKNTPLEKTWRILTDIEKYPRRVKYVKKTKIYGTGIGSRWDDITTILWIPMRMRHTVKSFDKNKEYSFIIRFLANGHMEQKYEISQKDGTAIIQALVTYDLGNKLLNMTLGSILEKRLKNMLVSSFQKTGGEVQIQK